MIELLLWTLYSHHRNSITVVLLDWRITETLKSLLIDILLLCVNVARPHPRAIDTAKQRPCRVVLEDPDLFVVLLMFIFVLLKLWLIHGLPSLLFYLLPSSPILHDNPIPEHPSLLPIIPDNLEWGLLLLEIIERLCPDDDSWKNHLIRKGRR